MQKYFILMISDDENICRKFSYGVIKDSNINEFTVTLNNSVINYLVFDKSQLDYYYRFIETLKPYTQRIIL